MSHDHVTRRGFLKCSVAAAGALAFSRSAHGADEARPPNVVLIISDDQGWADYGFMGHHIRTPHLDRLASQSVTFTRGYVAAPLCCPSLASMITGLHPHQHKITCNDPPYAGDPKERWTKPWTPERRQQRDEMMSAIGEVPTLPRMLSQRGYLSMQTGKWWAGSYADGGFTHGMTHGDQARGGRHGDLGLTIGRQSMQPIFDFIAGAASQPFFLWYAPMLPHQPHDPPERILATYKDKTPSPHIAKYWAMCEWFDETCGQLLDYLDANALADNTVVLYVCDNGWIQQEDRANPAPRSKTTPYEGGTRTPVMVRWPGHAAPRRDNETLVSSVDLAPTILSACGLKPTDAMQGLDLLDQSALSRRDHVVGASYTHDARDVADPDKNLVSRWVIRGWWKLLVWEPEPGRTRPPELYDLQSDPEETTDLASKQPDIVRELRALIDQWYCPKRESPAP